MNVRGLLPQKLCCSDRRETYIIYYRNKCSQSLKIFQQSLHSSCLFVWLVCFVFSFFFCFIFVVPSSLASFHTQFAYSSEVSHKQEAALSLLSVYRQDSEVLSEPAVTRSSSCYLLHICLHQGDMWLYWLTKEDQLVSLLYVNMKIICVPETSCRIEIRAYIYVV